MKKALILLSSAILLMVAGCGNTDETVEKSNEEQTETTTNEEATNQDSGEGEEEVIEEDPETILSTYYNARKDKDYQGMAPYLSEKNFTYSDLPNKEAFLKKMEEDDYVDNVEVAEFKINEFKDIDEDIKYAEVLSKGTVNGEESSAKDTLYMIKEDGQWKIDYIGVSSSDKFETVSLDISEFSELELLNFYNNDKQLRFKWENKLTDNGIAIGWADNAIAILKTDQNEYQVSLQNEKLEPGASFEQYRMYFESVEGEPESITISGLYVLGKKGLPDPSQDPIDITINLQ